MGIDICAPKNRLSNSRAKIQAHLNAPGIIRQIATTAYERYLKIFRVE